MRAGRRGYRMRFAGSLGHGAALDCRQAANCPQNAPQRPTGAKRQDIGNRGRPQDGRPPQRTGAAHVAAEQSTTQAARCTACSRRAHGAERPQPRRADLQTVRVQATGRLQSVGSLQRRNRGHRRCNCCMCYGLCRAHGRCICEGRRGMQTGRTGRRARAASTRRQRVGRAPHMVSAGAGVGSSCRGRRGRRRDGPQARAGGRPQGACIASTGGVERRGSEAKPGAIGLQFCKTGQAEKTGPYRLANGKTGQF